MSILIRSNEMQQYAGVYLRQNYSTCFGCLSHPSSGVHQTVTAASGTGHITCQSLIRPRWGNHEYKIAVVSILARTGRENTAVHREYSCYCING